jgi:hypothetical protein
VCDLRGVIEDWARALRESVRRRHSRIPIGFPEDRRPECAVCAAFGGALNEGHQNLLDAVRSGCGKDRTGGRGYSAAVVGIGIGMKGGVLLVPEDRIEAALKVLKKLEEPD